MTGLMGSLLALIERRVDEAVRRMEATEIAREPEVLVYFARHYSKMGLADSAVTVLKRAAQLGFVCAPDTVDADAWLTAVRKCPSLRRCEPWRNINSPDMVDFRKVYVALADYQCMLR